MIEDTYAPLSRNFAFRSPLLPPLAHPTYERSLSVSLCLPAGVTTGGACVRTTSIDLFQLTYAPLLAKAGPCLSSLTVPTCAPPAFSAQRSSANDQPANFIAIQRTRSPRGDRVKLRAIPPIVGCIYMCVYVCMCVRVDFAARSTEKLSIPRYHHPSSSRLITCNSIIGEGGEG